jgi:hypothetical protein
LEECGRGVNLVRDMEEALYDEELITFGEKGAVVAGDPGIIQLESSLLDLGSSTTVCQGLILNPQIP